MHAWKSYCRSRGLKNDIEFSPPNCTLLRRGIFQVSQVYAWPLVIVGKTKVKNVHGIRVKFHVWRAIGVKDFGGS